AKAVFFLFKCVFHSLNIRDFEFLARCLGRKRKTTFFHLLSLCTSFPPGYRPRRSHTLMKTLIKKMRAFGVAALLALGLLGSQAAQAGPGGRVSFQTFYDELSPYGRWINDPEYGYVWAPRVEAEFQPYATRGHWVMTEYGNTWVSD